MTGLNTRGRRTLGYRTLGATSVAVLAITVLAACAPAAGGAAGPADTLRLGYLATITHEVPVLGVAQGIFAKSLGATSLQTEVFNAGPAMVEALLAGAVDAAFIGPNPAINAFARSGGQAVRIVAGAASGGAGFVVSSRITTPAQLRGRTVADPQLGGTQDVALRYWLRSQGFTAPITGSGDVIVAPQPSAQILGLFRAGQLDGAFLPEPWVSQLVAAGGHVLVDERSLWPKGQFVSTNLIVSTAFLTAHPAAVAALIHGELVTVDWIGADPNRAVAALGRALKALGKALPSPLLTSAAAKVTVTLDPLAATLRELAAHAVTVGTLPEIDLHGIYDLRLLNKELRAAGRSAVDSAGLGPK